MQNCTRDVHYFDSLEFHHVEKHESYYNTKIK